MGRAIVATILFFGIAIAGAYWTRREQPTEFEKDPKPWTRAQRWVVALLAVAAIAEIAAVIAMRSPR